MDGPDHACSLPISELNNFVTNLKEIKKSVTKKRQLTNLEKETLKVARKSLYYSRDLKKGSVIKFKDLIPLRPAENNISPKKFKIYLGKKLKKNRKKYTSLRDTDFK